MGWWGVGKGEMGLQSSGGPEQDCERWEAACRRWRRGPQHIIYTGDKITCKNQRLRKRSKTIRFFRRQKRWLLTKQNQATTQYDILKIIWISAYKRRGCHVTQPVIVGAGTQRYMSGPDTCAQKADIYRCKRSVLTRRIRLFLGQSYGYELLLKLLCFITAKFPLRQVAICNTGIHFLRK